MTAFEYSGTELDLFAHVVHWKAYWRDAIRPHVRGRVLEVGAGFGSNTLWLRDLPWSEWTCVEPDALLARRLRAGVLPDARTRVVEGTLADVEDAPAFDCALYLDVLEHVEDDRGEARAALRRLAPGGRLVVLAPAHQSLYSPFDRAIGHFRRYDKDSLRAIGPPGATLVELRYLDSVGLLASLANRVLLRQGMPTERQLRFWDGRLVPVSRRLDPLLRHRLGKSILATWRREA
jgi:SAM-dependent methyltransferase